MRFLSLGGRVLASASVFLLSVASCAKKNDPPPQQPYPYTGYGPAPATGYYGPAPAPQPAPAAMAPAIGFPCQSDNELQCPFGHCINGRCGGCSQPADCKSNAVCVPTWLGASCWPGAPVVAYPSPQAPAPGPAPRPAPAPVPVPAPAPAAPTDSDAAMRDRCVALTNMYRARVGVPAVARDSASESCADRQAAADGRGNVAHGNFGSCNEFAQNTCPNYPGETLDQVMTRCFQQMFEEGPGGGHYDNMTSRRYSRVFCGFAVTGRNRFWVNQDFR